MDFRSTYILKFQIEGASQMRSAVGDMAKNLKDIAGVHTAHIKADVQKIGSEDILPEAATAGVLARVKGIGAAFLSVKTIVASVGAAIAALGVAKVIGEIKELGSSILTTTETLKMTEARFKAIYGDDAEAGWEFVNKSINRVKGGLQEIVNAAILIKAAGGPLGLDLESLQNGIELLDDINRLVVLKPELGLVSAAQALSKVLSGSFESLREQYYITKEMIAQRLKIDPESITGEGLEKTKARLWAVREYLQQSISQDAITQMMDQWSTKLTSFTDQLDKMKLDIGEKSGMYASCVKTLDEVTKEFEKFRDTPLWNEIAKKIGSPFTGFADSIRTGIAEAKKLLESGAGMDAAIRKFGEIVGVELRKNTVILGKIAYEIGKEVALPFVQGVSDALTGFGDLRNEIEELGKGRYKSQSFNEACKALWASRDAAAANTRKAMEKADEEAPSEATWRGLKALGAKAPWDVGPSGGWPEERKMTAAPPPVTRKDEAAATQEKAADKQNEAADKNLAAAAGRAGAGTTAPGGMPAGKAGIGSFQPTPPDQLAAARQAAIQQQGDKYGWFGPKARGYLFGGGVWPGEEGVVPATLAGQGQMAKERPRVGANAGPERFDAAMEKFSAAVEQFAKAKAPEVTGKESAVSQQGIYGLLKSIDEQLRQQNAIKGGTRVLRNKDFEEMTSPMPL